MKRALIALVCRGKLEIRSAKSIRGLALGRKTSLAAREWYSGIVLLILASSLQDDRGVQ